MNPREQPGLPLALIALCTTGGGGGFVPANIYIMGGGPPWGIQPFRARPPARLKSTSSTTRPGAIPEQVRHVSLPAAHPGRSGAVGVHLNRFSSLMCTREGFPTPAIAAAAHSRMPPPRMRTNLAARLGGFETAQHIPNVSFSTFSIVPTYTGLHCIGRPHPHHRRCACARRLRRASVRGLHGQPVPQPLLHLHPAGRAQDLRAKECGRKAGAHGV